MATGYGETLRKIRQGRGVSQEWVHVRAKELGFEKPISTACVKKIELKVHKPHELTLVQLRAIFLEFPRS